MTLVSEPESGRLVSYMIVHDLEKVAKGKGEGKENTKSTELIQNRIKVVRRRRHILQPRADLSTLCALSSATPCPLSMNVGNAGEMLCLSH